ncbi:MAG TPA: D-glucuronyl C5-epimerase family protein, partial [Chryseolinea sp.]|nr:D-glucuronyl C5-epimerase family protein [Chryseolinea sp.]
EKGVPYIIESTIGKQRNPMTICNKALSYHEKFIQGDSSQKILFLNCADWLGGDLIKSDSFSVLKYDYNWPVNNMVAPWRSGLANGVSLHVFIKAHKITGDEKYLSTAKQILNSFYVEVKDGGVTYKSETDGWWFEEFADEGGFDSRVLNGHMFAAIGIHDYFLYTKDSAAKYLFDQGLLGLKNNLSKYDNVGGPSFYDRRGTITNIKYHAIHVDLLNQLFQISGDPLYKTYSEKWGAFKHPSLTKRLISPPVKRIDMAIWLFNFVFTLLIVFVMFYVISKKSR